jgi:cytochrome c-type biogenesis protein CcmH/NrfG
LLRQAETADATYDPAYGYLGIVLFGQADYAGAVSQLTHYLANGPDPALKTEAAKALAAAKTDEAAQRSAP